MTKRTRWDSSSDEEDEISKTKYENDEILEKQILSICSEDNGNTKRPADGVIGNAAADNTFTKHNPLLQGCRSVYSSYHRIQRIDEGTYGVVWKAMDLSTKEVVALKQIKFDPQLSKDGFPVAALREISILLSLSHPNIVTVREMVVGEKSDKVFMVMEVRLFDCVMRERGFDGGISDLTISTTNHKNDTKYYVYKHMEMDLHEAIEQSGKCPFSQSENKYMLYQLLSAVNHIHSNWILHRDLKTSNILVHRSGRIAVCDFGLARKYQNPAIKMTQTVVTLWYRPPEILLGETVYGPEIDMWSVGCIFGELLQKEAILKGQGELDQIDLIFKLLGVPTDDSWPGYKNLPSSMFRWRKTTEPTLRKTFPINSFSGGQSFLDSIGYDLLTKLLTLDPEKRIKADEALKHEYFCTGVHLESPAFQFKHETNA